MCKHVDGESDLYQKAGFLLYETRATGPLCYNLCEMEGLIVMGLCFMFLALAWVFYVVPKQNRERQDEFMRRLRDLQAKADDDESGAEGEEEVEEEK